MRAWARPLLLAPALVLCVAGGARADAVGMPPEDCPPGSIGTSTHDGAYCTPLDCDSDASCSAAHGREHPTCRPGVGLCIETRTGYGGLRPPGMPPVVYEVATASCTTDADCPSGIHCELASRCTTRTAGEFVSGAFGCTARGSARSGVLPLLAGAAVLVALARRSRRR